MIKYNQRLSNTFYETVENATPKELHLMMAKQIVAIDRLKQIKSLVREYLSQAGENVPEDSEYLANILYNRRTGIFSYRTDHGTYEF